MIETLAFLQNIGFTEILVVVLIVLLLFGSAKIPQLMRSMGSGVNEFKKGIKEGEKEAEKPPEKPPEEKK